MDFTECVQLSKTHPKPTFVCARSFGEAAEGGEALRQNMCSSERSKLNLLGNLMGMEGSLRSERKPQSVMTQRIEQTRKEIFHLLPSVGFPSWMMNLQSLPETIEKEIAINQNVFSSRNTMGAINN